MQTRNLKSLFLLFLSGMAIVACTADEKDELRGSLYFAYGPYVALLDLRDGSTSVATNLGDAEIQSLSPQLDNRLLLTVFGNENQRDAHRLVLYDLETQQTLTLLNGREGHYLPGTRTLVFDDGVRIYITEKIKGAWEKTEVVEHRYNAVVEIVPISATRFIYRVADGPLFVYDKTAGRSIALSGLDQVCRPDRALWIERREQMLCQVRREDGTFEYAFVGLDGSKHEMLPLPAAQDFRPVAWLADQDTLVLTEQWFSWFTKRPRSAIWILRIDTGDVYRLVDDQYLGESVFYRGS